MAYIGFGPLNTFSPVPSKDSFTGDGSTTTFDLENEVVFGGENALEVFVDNVRQEPGTGKAYTLDLDGNLKNKRITFSAAPASGAAIYVINDKTSNTTIISPTDLNGVEFILDADQDTSITADTDDRIDFKLNGTDHIQLGTSSGDTTIKIATDAKDLQFLQADGRNILEINDAGYVALGNGATGSGQLRIYEDTDNGTNYSAFQVGTQSADITYTLPTADGTSGFQLTTNGSGVLSWAAAQIALANDGNNRIVTGTGSAGLNAEAGLTYDGSTLAVTGAVTVSTSIDVDGTTNLDAVDIDGAVQIDATLSVGVDDTGYDVKLFGDTASAFMLWDASADDLILSGAAGLIVPEGQFTLGSTAVTSTAAELNLLDGVSGLVQADLTKLAALDVTAAELNLLDDKDATHLAVPGKIGGTNFTSSLLIGHATTGTLNAAEKNIGIGTTALDALTSGDTNIAIGHDSGTRINSGQRNVLVGVDTGNYITSGQMHTFVGNGAGIKCETGSHNVGIGHESIHGGGGSYHTTKNTAIGSQSLRGMISGNGNIAVGYEAGNNITSGDGNVVIGNADVASATGDDQLSISDGEDGSVVWITGDSSGNVTLGGNLIIGSATVTEAQLEILDGATITTTELNLIDGGTSRGTDAVASGDGLLINDAGTMKMTNVDTVSTYFSSHSVGGGNIVTTGALGSGSIAAGFGAIDNGTSGIRTNTFTAETSFLPDAQDGAALGTTSLQFSDLFLADGAVIGLGDDNEVTLTHVADTGLTLNSTNKLMFNDASQFIQGASATVLDIAATDEIELTATLIEVVGNATVSGTLGVTGVTTSNAGVVVDNITIDGTEIDLSSGDLTVDVAGDIILDAGGGNIKVSVATTQILDIANSSSDVIIKPVVDAKDIIFQQRDGTSILEINDGAYARFTAAAVAPEATLSDASTVTWNALTQSVAKVTLGGNRTIGLASGGIAGAFISILVIQDGTGSRTVTWNAAYEFAANTAPTLTTTADLGDLFVFRYNGAKWLETGRNLALVLS